MVWLIFEAMMVMVSDLATETTPSESVTVTLKVDDAALDAVVPEMMPVNGSSVRPEGSVPDEMAQVE